MAEDAYRIELEFVENLKFSGIFNNKKILKVITALQNKHITKNEPIFFFGFVKYRVGWIRAPKL